MLIAEQYLHKAVHLYSLANINGMVGLEFDPQPYKNYQIDLQVMRGKQWLNKGRFFDEVAHIGHQINWHDIHSRK